MSKWLQWKEIRHQVAIAGRVIDARTNKAIKGVLVSITRAPAAFTNWLAVKALQYDETQWANMFERPDRTRTAPDGHFHFMDLPDGQYTLTASLPGSGSRYGEVKKRVTVTHDNGGDITMAEVELALPSTTIKGKIGNRNNKPVVMAEVRLKGSGEYVFSDSKGDYLLAGLETGKRTVVVSAQGYKSNVRVVSVEKVGTMKTANFVLEAS